MEKKFVIKILVLFPVVICVVLFLPAGSFRFWEGWIYSVALFIPMAMTLFYLVKKDPELLKRRLRFKEKEEKQKIITRLFRLPLILCFLIPGLDYRFGWSDIPPVLVVTANIMVFLGYLLVFLVFRENSYASRIVEIEEGQNVISTGPYSIIRHPMYLGISIMYLFTPIALGSWWALILFMLFPVVLIIRILNEEKVLLKELAGYKEYCQKTRYRLIPYLW